ncbi:hypothetical protein LNP25_14315 [Klebsiella variicola subsp. variicola]|nr:hypothetical protein [Klebsiella variicola subsp. variicola]
MPISTRWADIIEAGFNIRGVIPNNEAIVSVAQKMLGVETMSILLLGFIFQPDYRPLYQV